MLEKQFDHKIKEKQWYSIWENSGAFSASPKNSKKSYTIMMPPPNVTGNLHIGHALTFTLQDILIRFNRKMGFDVLWQPGMDHAGIATQMVVERNLLKDNIFRSDLGRDEFIKKVWEWKKESGGMITKQLRSLGASPDWKRERFTLDEGLSKAVRKVFVQLYDEGLIYKDNRLVNWDPKLLTAISDLEVENKSVKSKMWYIKYTTKDNKRSIVVATTRPETMLGDTAVAVHPLDKRYSDLIGKTLVLPLVKREIPIIADEYSDPDKGSGAVKITPGHDFNDFDVGKRHDLEVINIFDKKACIVDTEFTKKYAGLDRFVARKKIIEDLEKENFLVKVEDVENVLPYGDRSGEIIEPWLMEQWYVNAKVLAKPTIDAVKEGKMRFIPRNWENLFFEWMNNIQPWCISRQLWWGHRIPVWYGPDKTTFVELDEEKALKKAEEHYGHKVSLKQEDDVLDTWFSSALWPFSTLGWPDQTDELKKYYPGSVLVTGFDIIFFWVARMMMMGMHFMNDKIPFKDIYIHGLVRDEKGQKMSKSKGNVMDPLDLSDKYGADALRFTLAALATQGSDIKLSESRIAGYRNFSTKIWNAAKFLEYNNCIFNEGYKPINLKNSINIWIVNEFNYVLENLNENLISYRFNEAADVIYKFFWNYYCDWYIELIKPSLSEQKSSEEITEIRNVSSWILFNSLSIINPFMPYITETVAKDYFGSKELLISSKWPEKCPISDNNNAKNEINFLISLLTEIRIIRSELSIPYKQKLDLLIKNNESLKLTIIRKYEKIISDISKLSSIKIVDNNFPKGSATGVVEDVSIGIPLSVLINLDDEIIRLKKEINKVEEEIKKFEQNLNNLNFINRAPEKVVNDLKDKKKIQIVKKNKLNEALNRLEF
jgi:valyl-tRNA synthetase